MKDYFRQYVKMHNYSLLKTKEHSTLCYFSALIFAHFAEIAYLCTRKMKVRGSEVPHFSLIKPKNTKT